VSLIYELLNVSKVNYYQYVVNYNHIVK